MKKTYAYLYITQIIDLVLTLVWLRLGFQEANPILAHFLSKNVGFFILVKCTLGIGGTYILHMQTRDLQVIEWLLTIVYGAVMLVHILTACAYWGVLPLGAF